MGMQSDRSAFRLRLRCSSAGQTALPSIDKTDLSTPTIFEDLNSSAMLTNFLFSARRYLRLCRESLTRSTGPGKPTPRGKAFRLLLFIGFLPIWLIHWLCFFLDELCFPDYHDTPIERPLFVLGVPRSGTTFLHRTLAADVERFSTLATWEVFLAPTIIQRKFLAFLGAVDRSFGGPGARLIRAAERGLFQGLDGVHDMSLNEPEEDYLLLLSIFATFILVLPFSKSESIWRLSRFDTEMPEAEKRRIMGFYKACLRKHLYVYGAGRRFLSKNAAFASWVDALRDDFPDAGFVFCFRDPEKAVPSLLGSLDIGAEMFEIDLNDGEFPERMTRMMRHYYQHLLARKDGAALVHMDDLKSDLVGAVTAIYAHLGISMPPAYRRRLDEIAREARTYRSKARHITPRRLRSGDFLKDQFTEYYQWKQNRSAQ